MIELLYLALYVLAAYGTGSFALQAVKIRFRNAGEEAVFSQAAGLVMFALATFALGLMGLLYDALFRILAILLVAAFFRRIKAYLLWLLQSIHWKFRFDNLLTAVIAAFILLNIIAALAPVHSSDAIAHHVALPKIYAEQHRITSIPDIIPSNYPMAVNMLFLDGYLLAGGILSELIAAYIGILSALAIYYFCARYFSRRTGIIAAAIFYTLPIFSLYNVRGFVDIGTGLFAFLAIYAFFMWNETKERQIVLLSAVFAGFAASTKTSAVVVPAVAGGLFACSYLRRKRISMDLALFGAVALAIMLPWIIRAYASTGNPVYPLLYSVFGGTHLNPVLAQFWIDTLSTAGFGKSAPDFLALPWNVTMHSSAFKESTGIGPAFLAYIPVLLLMKGVDRKIFVVLLTAAAFIITWFLTAQLLRYIFVVFALLAIVSGYALSGMLKEKWLKAAGIVSFAAILLIHAGMWAGTNSDEVGAAIGLQSEDEFLRQKVSNYEILKFANENLDNAKICLYGDIRGYYSKHEYVGCHPAWQGYVDFSSINNSGQLLGRFEEIGITHLLVDNTVYAHKNITTRTYLVDRGNAIVDDLAQNQTLIYENEKGKLYELDYD
ncbi:glycosyltransferase family 39 protein [Candidatus Woesearchaeota archaeon]|nr:glycosyltransferase family 39 protein [Candidatus Woesearchaeota archaeon]